MTFETTAAPPMRDQPAPRVSVGVPVYNGERYLADALEALLKQSYLDLEIIIGDNASNDRTPAIARAFASRDERVRYVRHERNLGVAGNFQRLFELSRGEFFKWAASDDLIDPDAIRCCVEALDAHSDAVLAYSRSCLIDEHGAALEDYDDRMHLQATHASDRFRECFERLRLCNVLYGVHRSDALRHTGGLGSYVASDIVLLAELTLHGTFWEVPERLFYRRFHPDASSAMRGHALAAYYRPHAGGEVTLQETRHQWELWRALSRAPISMAEKARVAKQLLRRARWNRDQIARELWHVSLGRPHASTRARAATTAD